MNANFIAVPNPPVPSDDVAAFGRRGNVGLLTLNRPRAMNAINRALADAIGAALETAQNDPDIRAVVVTGAGRAFCAGADLKVMAAGKDGYPTGHREWDFAGLVRHWIDKPLIAAVNGFALGGGTEIVLACDLVVIDEGADLGLPEVTRGLFAAAGGLLRLQRQVPFKVASEMASLGRRSPRRAPMSLVWSTVSRGLAPRSTMHWRWRRPSLPTARSQCAKPSV